MRARISKRDRRQAPCQAAGKAAATGSHSFSRRRTSPSSQVQRIALLPFYHAVPHEHARGFKRHALKLLRRGSFISWDEAQAILSGTASLDHPHFCLSFDDGDKSWVKVLLPILTELSIPATFFPIASSVDSHAGSSRLTWQDCRELAAHGMSFGSHSLTHRPLASLSDSEAQSELYDSKAEIEDQLGQPIVDFSAPYGRPGKDFLVDRDVALAREAGYRSFATTARGPMGPGDSPMAILRLGLSPAWPVWAVRTRLHE
jgi:peptidoglycan/xylan/chitin deacetylase (PgdA/CDA1 family)